MTHVPTPARWRFAEAAPRRVPAVAVIFDLEGFTPFCRQPEVAHRLPALLNGMFEVLCSSLDEHWTESAGYTFVVDGKTPSHVKFLGDGALLVWVSPSPPVDRTFIKHLISRLFIARTTYPDFAANFREQYGLLGLPTALRIGIAAGELLELSLNGQAEFVGFSINLASRLQGYCGSSLGFLVSGRTGLDVDELAALGFQRVLAPKLKGFETEVVLVDSEDFRGVPARLRRQLFSDLDG